MNKTIGIIAAATTLAVALAVGAGAEETKGSATPVASSKSAAPAKSGAAKSGVTKSGVTNLASAAGSTKSKSAGESEKAKAGAAKKAEAPKEMTYTAQVVDLNAYVMHGTVPSSMGSATETTTGTPQYGLVIKDVLYVPIMKDNSSPASLLSGQVGKNITVTGIKEQAGGAHFLVISPTATPAPVH